MSFTNAVRILQDMQDFLHNIRGHMESSHSSDSEHTSEEFSSAAPSETTLTVKKPRSTQTGAGAGAEVEESLIDVTPETDGSRSPTVTAVLAIVRCTVCLEVPRSYTYQCARGHLVCEMCLCYLINNARKIGETALCPTCRGVIRKETSWRNNAIEDVAAELPSECKHCFKEFKIKYLNVHEEKCCSQRLVKCKLKNFGCNWIGPQETQNEHHNSCPIGKSNLFSLIDKIDEKAECERQKSEALTDLLCGVGVEQLDLELRPYVTLGDMKKILYDSPTFKAFNTFWCITAKIEPQNSDTNDCDRLVFRLLWKTPRHGVYNVRFVILRGPYNDMEIEAKVYTNRFTEDQPKTEYIDFPFASEVEYVKQISNSSIPFRLLMSWEQ